MYKVEEILAGLAYFKGRGILDIVSHDSLIKVYIRGAQNTPASAIFYLERMGWCFDSYEGIFFHYA